MRRDWPTEHSNLSAPAGIPRPILHLLGDIATHPGRFDADTGAKDCYRKALALAEPRSMRPLIAHCHFGLGRLYRNTGKREQAHEHLNIAKVMYREMDMHYYLEQVESASTQLAVAALSVIWHCHTGGVHIGCPVPIAGCHGRSMSNFFTSRSPPIPQRLDSMTARCLAGYLLGMPMA